MRGGASVLEGKRAARVVRRRVGIRLGSRICVCMAWERILIEGWLISNLIIISFKVWGLVLCEGGRRELRKGRTCMRLFGHENSNS